MEVDRLTYFEGVLSLIHIDEIRDFCKLLLTDADDYFFENAASSTGKYHPQYALGNGGLARHSITVALIMNDILETNCYDFTRIEKDLLICAAIVHDIKKYGNGNSSFTVKNHPELAGDYVIEECKKTNLKSDYAIFIYDAVLTHMGQFGNIQPHTDAQKLLHIADCLASRKYLETNFNALELPKASVITESTVKSNKDPGDFLLTFGKYKGKKLKEIDDISYVDFLANKMENRGHPVVIKAQQYLNKIRKYGK